uniref:Uncharacterized protein n=1 Tax=Parascaris univalens TaxID=6257 RepID=A0A915CGN4_PARUN
MLTTLFTTTVFVVIVQKHYIAAKSVNSPCSPPPSSFLRKLPPNARNHLISIWSNHNDSKDCALEIALTRSVIENLSSTYQRNISSIRVHSTPKCALPDYFPRLPKKLQGRIVELWNGKNATENCTLLRHKARFTVLNQPPNIRHIMRAPAIPCGIPHFISRLDKSLQKQIRSIWLGYNSGKPCQEEIWKEISLLKRNNIAAESFFIPPPNALKRIDVRRTLFNFST